MCSIQTDITHTHLQAAQLNVAELSLALDGGDEASEQSLVGLGGLVEDPSVDGRGHQVVGGRDGVDVSGQVKVELLHRDHLRVASPCRTT